MAKVLMVCLGNICRSPLAEGILKSKVNNTVSIDSAGTGNYHVGEAPDPRSIQIAKKYGIDISQQRARQFKASDFDRFDHIYVMDQSNFQNVVKLARNPEDISKVKLILEEIQPDTKAEVPDPYFGGSNGFENVYRLLDEACAVIADKLND